MANFTFDATEQGFGGGNMVWEGSVGSPGLGALVDGFGSPTTSSGVNNASATVGSLSIPVIASDPFSFRFRIINDDGSGDGGNVTIELALDGSGHYTTGDTVTMPAGVPYDSGWLNVSGTLPGSDTITDVTITVTGAAGALYAVYVDSIYIAETPPADAGILYQGVDSLVQRLTLPFARAGVGALAVRYDGRVAVANDASGESPVVITAGPEDDYGSSTDETNDHPEEAVKRVVWVWT